VGDSEVDDDDRERVFEQSKSVTVIGHNERSTSSTIVCKRSRRNPESCVDNESEVNEWKIADSEIAVEVGGTAGRVR
jgi:hypothetical protein